MSEPINGGHPLQTEIPNEEAQQVKKQSKQVQQEDSQSNGSSSSSGSESSSGSDSESDHQEQRQKPQNPRVQPKQNQDQWQQDEEFSSQPVIKKKEKQSELMDKDQQGSKPQRGNGGLNENAFKSFNPKFTAGEDQEEEEQTRDQFRNQGRGGREGFDRGGRGGFNREAGRQSFYRGGRGGFDRGGGGRGGFDRGGRGGFDRGGRGGGRGGGDRNFGDRGFGDRGDRGGFRGRGGSFGDRGDNGGDRFGGGGGHGNRTFGDRQRGFNNNRNFDTNINSGVQNQNQSQNQFRNSGSGNNTSDMTNISQVPQNQFGFQGQQQKQVPTLPTAVQPNVAQFPPGMYPANYFPLLAGDPQGAFKKKNGFSEEQKLISSKVSKMSKAPSKHSKKAKKGKKKKHDSSSQSQNSSSSSDSSDEEGNRSLNMSLCQAVTDGDQSFIHALDELKKKQKEKRNDKKRFQKLQPSGRKDWPSAVLYVLGNTFEITFRNINEHSDCALVIPYEDTSMSLYPGTIINKSQIDYREKLEQKKDVLKPGSVYTQDNLLSKQFLYHCIAFVKIDSSAETVQNGLKYIFETLEKLQKKFKQLKNIVIPLSLFSHHTDKYIQFMKRIISLMESKKFKSVSLTTKSKEEWQTAMRAFTTHASEMINKNEIGV